MVPVKFVIGSRQVLAVPRLLDTVAFGLDGLVAGASLPIALEQTQGEGLRFLSLPMAALTDVRARFSRHILGGFQAYRRYYIEMEGRSYQDYLAGFSSKTRSTLGRKYRKLAERSGGALDIRDFNRADQIDAFMADAVPLSRRTYQTGLLDAGLPEGEEAIAGMKALARQDMMRAYILYLDGQAVSYLYLPTGGGIVTYAYLGYDPDHAQWSVGTVLQMEACSFFLLRPTVVNRLLIGALNAFDGGVSRVKGLAERHGSLAPLRRMLRG